MVTVLRLP